MIAFQKNRRGEFIVQLQLNPSDDLTSWALAPPGRRYRLAVQEVGDDEQLIEDEEEHRLKALIASAHLLCREEAFQQFLGFETGRVLLDEGSASDALCGLLGITSRAEFRDNKAARDAFVMLRDEYFGSSKV